MVRGNDRVNITDGASRRAVERTCQRRACERCLCFAPSGIPWLRRRWRVESVAPWSTGWIGGNGGVVVDGGAAGVFGTLVDQRGGWWLREASTSSASALSPDPLHRPPALSPALLGRQGPILPTAKACSEVQSTPEVLSPWMASGTQWRWRIGSYCDSNNNAFITDISLLDNSPGTGSSTVAGENSSDHRLPV